MVYISDTLVILSLRYTDRMNFAVSFWSRHLEKYRLTSEQRKTVDGTQTVWLFANTAKIPNVILRHQIFEVTM